MGLKRLTRKMIRKSAFYSLIISALIVILYRYPEYQKFYPLHEISIIFFTLFLAGFIIRYAGANLSGYERIQPLLISIGYVLIGVGLYKIVIFLMLPPPFDFYSQHIKILSFVVMVAMATLSVTNLFSYGEYIDNFEISRIFTGVLDSQKVIVLIVSLFFLYLVHLRDYITDMVINIDHADWIVIVLAAVILTQKFYVDLKQRVDYESDYSLGKKHRQSIKQFKDNRLDSLENLQREFVEDGKKEYLLTYLISILVNKSERFSDRKASRILKPLIYYRDRYVPKHSFKWWKDRIRKKNKDERRKVLEKVTEDINENMNFNISKIEEN